MYGYAASQERDVGHRALGSLARLSLREVCGAAGNVRLARFQFLLGFQSMIPGPEDLAAQYAQMSGTELMELARSYDGLREAAQAALRAEFARRGLEPPLVEELGEWELRRLVTVRRYRDLAEAYVGRSLLESAGIPAWVANENLVRMDWFYSNVIGGLRLQVDEGNEAAARELLEQAAPETIAYGQGEVFVQPNCPKCGSAEVTLGYGIGSSWPPPASNVSSSPLMPGEETWHCGACGAVWADDANREPQG
jgi:Putative prokaryotic signal transducing protein